MTMMTPPPCNKSLLQHLQHLVLVLFLSTAAIIIIMVSADHQSQPQHTIVTSLPGFPGPLPFNLETGYIGVGENEQDQLFYYFIESQGDPLADPLLFWLTGGPGCSAFYALIFEIGPIQFDIAKFDGNLPSLVTNPYSWTKEASIIFIDSPVGTGFSYTTSPQGYNVSDTKTAQQDSIFLRKWMLSHPKFMNNWVYVAGDSYGGKFVPMVALAIAEGNEAGLEPPILLQGYIIGNPMTDATGDGNEVIPYAHGMALISDKYFERWKSSCNGNYVNTDPDNIACDYALELVCQCIKHINVYHILEPKCRFMSPKSAGGCLLMDSLLVEEDHPTDDLIFLSPEELACRENTYGRSNVYMNNETVREALHIKKGTKGEWSVCNQSISYDKNIRSVVEYHRSLNEKGFQALVYSGDHDILIPYKSTLKWIHKLNLTVYDDWRPWNVHGQVVGYTEKYKNNQAFLTFATIKGAGHTAPEYKPKECFEMFQRWISLYQL